ncbi:MAG TPA: cupin domain-containing protein [Solirubrobacterales bacterium]|nr:cupin domain-containing protein [Solirubrobacterales bacterium]
MKEAADQNERNPMTPPPPEIPGIRRIDLQRHDLSAPGREVIQNRVDISSEAPATRHFHPGEEVIYVLEGTIEYQIDGEPAQMVGTGEVLAVPAERIHSAKNVGAGPAAELATYIVEKGKPLVTVAD